MIHLRRSLLVGMACAWLVACLPDADDETGGEARDSGANADTTGAGPSAERPAPDVRTGVGSARGIVRDAATDRPIGGVLVSAGPATTSTDTDGSYVLAPLPAGEWTIRAYERGYSADSASVASVAGRVASVDFALAPAASPCCELAGRWSARFTLDSAGIGAAPRRRELGGVLVFEADPGDAGDRVATSTGSSDLDFGPMLDAGSARVGDLEGITFAGDSVAVTLLPRFGDWAIELRGRHAGDTIRGDWFQRASCCGAYGEFVLSRDGT